MLQLSHFFAELAQSLSSGFNKQKFIISDYFFPWKRWNIATRPILNHRIPNMIEITVSPDYFKISCKLLLKYLRYRIHANCIQYNSKWLPSLLLDLIHSQLSKVNRSVLLRLDQQLEQIFICMAPLVQIFVLIYKKIANLRLV
jgi:hypothetical protein